MNKPWDYGVLKVSSNGRYLINGTKPFFWMGDTAWLVFQKLTLEESFQYLKNRKEKGYTIILSDFIHSPEQTNLNGDTPLVDQNFNEINTAGDYWEHIDKVVAMAEELGLYMGILPVWGSSMVKGGYLTTDNLETYMNFILDRYKNYPNLVWIVGGDVRGNVNETVFNKTGEMMKAKNPDRLVGYHPFGRTSSSTWFHDKTWLDFNMFQSGHRRYDQASLGAWDDNAVTEEYFGEDNWRYVSKDYELNPPKPTIDGEPSYEEILQGLHDESQPYWKARDVRRYAYWAVFAGAFGHTYGHNSIMQFYRESEKKGAFGAKTFWQDALHHEGGAQMRHLSDLMNSVDFVNGHPAQELLLSGQGSRYDYNLVFAGAGYIFCYIYNGNAVTVDVTSFSGKTMDVYWYDPVCGTYSFIKEVTGQESLTAKPVTREDGSSDFVLVIKEIRDRCSLPCNCFT